MQASGTKTETGQTPKHKSLTKKEIFLVIGIVALLLWGLWSLWNVIKPEPKTLRVSGRIEGYETNLGAKIGGRVDMVAVYEGDYIKKGQHVAQISDADIQAQMHAAEHRKLEADEKADEAAYQIKVLNHQREEAGFRLTQSGESSPAQIHQQEQNVAQSQAQLANAEANVVQAEADRDLAAIRRDRYDFLVKRGAVTQDEDDQARTNYGTTSAVLEAKQAAKQAAIRQLKAAEAQLEQVRTVRLDPSIRNEELLAVEKQLIQAKHSLSSAELEAKAADEDRKQILANISYQKILSPINGIITARPIEPGAVVVPGDVVLSAINLDVVYLRAYVAEGYIGKLRVGEKANVYLDSDPNKPFAGEVIEVDPEGSFTPENIYFKDDRVRQVFGIKIGMYHPGWFAKPGMPADADIILDSMPNQKK